MLPASPRSKNPRIFSDPMPLKSGCPLRRGVSTFADELAGDAFADILAAGSDIFREAPS